MKGASEATRNPPNQEPVIRTAGLSKSFGHVQALESLDLEVPRNSIMGFLGPNGAGKSTTIRLLLGLNRPSAGAGSIFGLDIVQNSVEIRQRVGYLAQDPQFYEDLTARENLHFIARFFYKGPEAGIRNRVQEMIDLVGLSGKADRRVKGFSGGERQRLGIAQAQINEPELLILDEPAAALDPMGRHAVLEIMAQLREQATIFYSTHILDDVQKVSDRVAILNRGRMISQGPIDQLLLGEEGAAFKLITRGDVRGTQDRLRRVSWIRDFSLRADDGIARWRIFVDDEGAAQSQLLREVLGDPDVDVLEFGREAHELEEIFIKLVEGA